MDDILGKLGWPRESTSIRAVDLHGASGCEIYSAYDRRTLDGASVGVARLPDGGLLMSTEPGALDRVFSTCLTAGTPAGTLAELVARFGPRPARLRVLHDDGLAAGRILLRRAGEPFSPPRGGTDGGRHVTFFGLSADGGLLFQVEARQAGERVGVTVRRLDAR